MTEADIDVLNVLHNYYQIYSKYPSQVEVTPEIWLEMSQKVFYFHVFEDERVPCVLSRSQPTYLPRSKRDFEEVTVTIIEVNDPVVLGKPFNVEREHRFPELAKQLARIAFQEQCKKYIQQGLRVDNVQEEETMIEYQPPTFLYRIFGFTYGDLDSLIEEEAS